jgi:hypothetical protein
MLPCALEYTIASPAQVTTNNKQKIMGIHQVLSLIQYLGFGKCRVIPGKCVFTDQVSETYGQRLYKAKFEFLVPFFWRPKSVQVPNHRPPEPFTNYCYSSPGISAAIFSGKERRCEGHSLEGCILQNVANELSHWSASHSKLITRSTQLVSCTRTVLQG